MFKLGVVYQTSNTNTAGNANSLALTKPSGTVDGDLLITAIAFRGTTVSTLSGWTLILTQASDGGGTPINIGVYYKIANGEGSSYTWSLGATTLIAGIVIRINGQDTSGYIDANEGGGSNGGGTSMTFGSTGLTPSKSESLLLQFWAPFNLGGNVNSVSAEAIATSNPTWTEACDLDINNGASHLGFAVAYANRTATSATGASTATSGASTNQYSGILIVIKRITAFTASVTDTVTDTDAIAVKSGYKVSVSDTETSSDSVLATKSRSWTQDNKNTNTNWTNDQKS